MVTKNSVSPQQKTERFETFCFFCHSVLTPLNYQMAPLPSFIGNLRSMYICVWIEMKLFHFNPYTMHYFNLQNIICNLAD